MQDNKNKKEKKHQKLNMSNNKTQRKDNTVVLFKQKILRYINYTAKNVFEIFWL